MGGSPRRKNKVKKRRQIMRGLVLSGLLACAHGLGDTFPYLNTAGHVWDVQTTLEWIANSCNTGTKQSPIDIVSTAAATPTVDPGALVAKGFNADRPLTWQVAGATGGNPVAVTAQITDAGLGGTPLLFGGPLETDYAFSHFEFHFGSTAGTILGAEHSIDGVKAAMEMHAVFYKNELTLTQETAAAASAVAAATPNGANGGYTRAVIAATTAPVDPAGVAVVAYQIDVGDSNPELKILTDAMTAQNTLAPVGADSAVFWSTSDTSGTFDIAPSATGNVNMSTLMMLDDGALEDYYFYDGSLTAPADDTATNPTHSCAEIVRWIIPTQRLTMTAAEMAAFNLNANWGATDFGDRNSRPTQTGDRITGITVNHRVKPVAAIKDSTAIWSNLAGTLLSVGTFGLVHNLLTQESGSAKSAEDLSNPVVDFLQGIEQRLAAPAVPQERHSYNHRHPPQDIQY